MDVLVMVYGWFMGNIFFLRDHGTKDINCDLVTYVVLRTLCMDVYEVYWGYPIVIYSLRPFEPILVVLSKL